MTTSTAEHRQPSEPGQGSLEARPSSGDERNSPAGYQPPGAVGALKLMPLYDDGRVRLHRGDARELLDRLTEGERNVALVCDPPYGISYASNQNGRYRGKGIGGDSSDWLMRWVVGWARSRGDAPAYVFGSWKVQPPEGTRAVLIWDKGLGVGMGDLTLPWKPNWEQIFVLGEGHQGHRSDSVLKGHTVVSWADNRAARLHPNEKPVSLMQELLLKLPPDHTVVDPFAGSGTTLRAAKDLGRRAIGIEIDPEHAATAVQRLGQENLFT